MMITFFIITGLYFIVILSFVYGFGKVEEFVTDSQQHHTKFSIIIPFRDEAIHLPQLLNSIKDLQYPVHQFECIFINDDSTDNSIEIIHEHLSKTEIVYSVLNNLRTSTSPKKDAIETAIKRAQFDWIITTDADCILPKNWLLQFGVFSTVNNSKMIVGPVTYKSDNYSFLEHFQILDFLSLQGATVGGFGIGKPFLCNGANLAYQKETFLELHGFDGNNTIASGDDIFLFEKFYKAYPNQVQFLKSKDAIVTTNAVKMWNELIHQRIRWAAKSSSYHLWFGKFVGFIVLLMNLVLIIAMVGLLWSLGATINFLYIILFKISVDFALIKKTSYFYRRKKKRIRGYGFGSLFYPFFSLYIVFKTLTSKYHWKGRKFKR